MTSQSKNRKGIAASLAASSLFGLLYYYVTLLAPLSGTDVLGWRILFTVPFLTLFLLKTGYWTLVEKIAKAMLKTRRLFPLLILSSLLLNAQMWVFLWAPINGKAMQVSLGYLLMPLSLVLCGRFIYKEHLLPFQKIAVGCAAFGVGNQIWQLGFTGLSWEVFLVALGYPAYFVLRRAMHTNHLGGLWFDMTLFLPFAIAAIHFSGPSWGLFANHPRMLALVPLLGGISAIAVFLYIYAGRNLPLGVFGLLGYVEPAMLVIVSLLLGERIQPEETLTYLGVGLAVGILALGGIRRMSPSAPRHVKR